LARRGKDIQDQAHAVDHPTVQATLQIAFLGGRQFMVENDDIGFGGRHQRRDFIGLAAPHKQGGVRAATLALNLSPDIKPRPHCQQTQFGHAVGKIRRPEIERHQDDALAARVPLNQLPFSVRPATNAS
jgi:hypothetical protein